MGVVRLKLALKLDIQSLEAHKTNQSASRYEHEEHAMTVHCPAPFKLIVYKHTDIPYSKPTANLLLDIRYSSGG